jgi:hypothetical protein
MSAIRLRLRNRSHALLHMELNERIEVIVKIPDAIDEFRIAVNHVEVLDVPVQSCHIART